MNIERFEDSNAVITPSERLARLGMTLPSLPTPAGMYLSAIRHKDLIYTAGHLPLLGGRPVCTDQVGETKAAGVIGIAEAAKLAQLCALNALASAAAVAGGLDQISGILRLTGYVAGVPSFSRHSAVIDGASQLLKAVFGPAGQHVRSAVGVATLPRSAPLELELVAIMSC
jgi:enamine deaminase RidA (YjgF/YER057c/UK114 family)